MVPFVLLLIFFSTASACNSCINYSKISVSSLTERLGSCGYGSIPPNLYQKYAAAASPKLYKDGIGCGACYKVKCKNSSTCTSQGIELVVTHVSNNNETDFSISKNALAALTGKKIPKPVDVEYKRIPCMYKNQNLTIRVAKESLHSDYLVIQFLFQGGQTNIVAVDAAQVGSFNWYYMAQCAQKQSWRLQRKLGGPLQLRLVVTSGYDGKYIWIKDALPKNWKPGQLYDTGVQITDIALDGCSSSCKGNNW